MSTEEISHKEIHDRLVAVETKVDRIEKGTVNVIAAFNAAQGAFTVLEWLGKIAKPVIWIGGLVGAATVLWENFRIR